MLLSIHVQSSLYQQSENLMTKLKKKDKRVILGLILIPFALSLRLLALYIPEIKSEKSKTQILKNWTDPQTDGQNDGKPVAWSDRGIRFHRRFIKIKTE